MKAQMFMTPVDNIKDNSIIDGQLTVIKEYDWLDDALVFNTLIDKVQEILIKDISILDHRLLIDDTQYHILNMRSRK
jgi:hypothetical protein